MIVVVDLKDRRLCWIEFCGTAEQAKKKKYDYIKDIGNASLGRQALKAQERPFNYADAGSESQWAMDKKLGILDWDGDPLT